MINTSRFNADFSNMEKVRETAHDAIEKVVYDAQVATIEEMKKLGDVVVVDQYNFLMAYEVGTPYADLIKFIRNHADEGAHLEFLENHYEFWGLQHG